MQCFRSSTCGSTIEGIEAVHVLRKGKQSRMAGMRGAGEVVTALFRTPLASALEEIRVSNNFCNKPKAALLRPA